ncbi:MAG: hypothetical protein EBR82_43195 [Caulobacteraceae bacterium]|nr:hypothetical protein [Caulobacteraceae bacterium]
MSALSIQPTYPIFTDIDGQPLEAGYIFIGTANLNPISNPISVYWDAALTQLATQPIRTISGYPANAGTPARLYVNSDYSIQVKNKNGSVVYSASAATERLGNLISFNDISGTLGSDRVEYNQGSPGALDRTVEDRLRDYVSIMDFIPENLHSTVRNFNNTTDSTAYIQDAMDSGVGSIFFPMGRYNVSSPIYITNGQPGSTQAANLTLVGENRTSTYIWVNEPFTPAPFNNPNSGLPVKSIFINQSDNGKFSLKNLRFQGQITGGHVLYALEDGANSQCIFSGEILDCWPSLSSDNNGVFYGGIQNFVVANNTFEQAKACFRLVGAGCGDIHFSNNSVFASYDPFISANEDTQPKNFINVSNLTVYSHYRGPVFAGNNARNWHISNVTLDGDTIAPLGTLGIGDFYDSSNITIDGFSCISTLNEVFRFNGVQAKISNGFIGPCEAAFKPYGNSTNTDLTIDNVNVTGAVFGAFWDATSSQGGNIRVNNCTWNNAGGNFWLTQGTPSYDVTITNSRFINAGFPNTTAGTRNLQFNTSGDVLVQNCEIGRTTTNAIAFYYLLQNGSGNCTVLDSRFTALAPPAGSGNEISSSTAPVKVMGGVGRRYAQFYGSPAPVAGTWNSGDIMFSTNPQTGINAGWVCVASGTPGTWLPFGQAGFITTIAGSPSFTGQIAIVGTNVYFAVATSSPSDWKIIT